VIERIRMTKSKDPKGALAFNCIIALGSNLGDKPANIDTAISLLTEEGDVKLRARSRNYATEPWGKTDQDWFVNACIAVKTGLSARELLARCQEVERRMGRVPTEKWGPRIIDLDLLIYGEETIRDPDLVLPHPYIAERAFVLAPLMDIAPDAVIAGRSVRELYAAVDTAGVRPLS
jgi:2-amino-4-hydroxy-6-hydroxymethyldihydropteridine diphosphokinase